MLDLGWGNKIYDDLWSLSFSEAFEFRLEEVSSIVVLRHVAFISFLLHLECFVGFYPSPQVCFVPVVSAGSE